MTRTTPELATPSLNFHATPAGGRLATTYEIMCNRPQHGGSSVESGFEPGTLRPQSRDLTTRPPRPPSKKGKRPSTNRGAHLKSGEGIVGKGISQANLDMSRDDEYLTNCYFLPNIKKSQIPVTNTTVIKV
ncbi:hypothetical protein AVEN_187831-1 [Araneus ventricosus]|uniref:Uncharacterized protein n=1 Tax=Araneus ventricosus TaxID=182803 RepID=A0A4Y2CTS1_ARAVE|nr:hypothetical protein AVEN_187831-1 [Araneus ventricosus]